MRVPSAGGAAGSRPSPRSLRLAARASSAVPAPAERAAAGPRAAVDDAGYVAIADRLQRRLDALWNERRGRYDPGPGATDDRGQRRPAARPLRRGAAAATHGPTRNDAPRAARSPASSSGPPVVDRAGRRPAPIRGSPGRAGRARRPVRSQHPVFDAEVVDGLAHAYLARAALGLDAGTVARIRDEIHRVAGERRLALAGAAAQPVQLVLRRCFAADATVNGTARGARARDWRATSRASSPASAARGAAAGNLGPGLRFHYLPARGPQRPMNVDSRRVREHRAQLLALLRQARARRHARRRAQLGAAARVGAARARRLLDARAAISTGTPAWASRAGTSARRSPLAQQALIGIAADARAAARPASGARGRSGCSTAASPPTRELAERERRDPGGARLRRATSSRRAAATPTSPPRATRPTRCARSRPASARRPASRAAGAVRLRPRHRPPRGHDARLQHRDRRRQPARVPVRRARHRAALRRPPGGRGEHRRAGAGRVRAARARRRRRVRCCARSTATRSSAGVTPLRLTRAPRGAGREPPAAASARLRGAVHRPAGAREPSARRAARDERRTASRRAAIDARWTLRGGPRAAAAGVTFPSWGRGARVAGDAARRAARSRLGARPLRARRRALAARRQRAQRLPRDAARPGRAAPRCGSSRPARSPPIPTPGRRSRSCSAPRAGTASPRGSPSIRRRPALPTDAMLAVTNYVTASSQTP